MTATAKKTLSVLMAFVLVLGLMPLPGTVQRAAATEVVEKTEVDAGGLTDKTESGQGDESTLSDAPEQGRTPDQGQTAGKVSQPGLQPAAEPNPQPEKNSPEQTEPTKVEQATASAAKDTLSKEGKGEGSVKKADEDKGPEMTAMANPGDPVVVDELAAAASYPGLKMIGIFSHLSRVEKLAVFGWQLSGNEKQVSRSLYWNIHCLRR